MCCHECIQGLPRHQKCFPAGAGVGAGIAGLEHGRHHTPGTHGTQSGYEGRQTGSGTGGVLFVLYMHMSSACTPLLDTGIVGISLQSAWPAACHLPNGDQDRNTSACHFVAAGSGSSIPGEYADNRTMGERAKDALPGTRRDSSTTGQGYGQEGRGLTSGTGAGEILHCLAPCCAAGCCTVWL